MDEGTKVLLALDKLDIPQDAPAQNLARFKPLHHERVLAGPLRLAVDVLERVGQIRGCDRDRRESLQQGGLLLLEVKGLLFLLVLARLGVSSGGGCGGTGRSYRRGTGGGTMSR